MPSLLDQVESQLAPKAISVVEFAESDHYCNPVEAPIWMADLSFRGIGQIEMGDEVMGWARQGHNRHLCASTVLDVKRRTASLVRVTTESGRSFRCTPDHRWLTCSNGGRKDGAYNQDGEWFCPPKEGQSIVRVVDETLTTVEQWDAAKWLGGLFDGEGSCGKNTALRIAQSDTHNPEVCSRIEEVLDLLGFTWTYTDRAYVLKAGDEDIRTSGVNGRSRQMIVDFANLCTPVRRQGLIEKAMGAGWRIPDRIVKVEPDVEEATVVSLTTTTGNYICNGYASKNCNKPLYPRQAVLLKLIFLEELTGAEEDVLDHWIAGGRNGTEILISPNIRERVEWLRENSYPHFREVILAGGRRSSKGFLTGIAMAYTMWNCLQLQDPGTFYGIDPEKEIYFSCIAGSEEQAKEYQYADFSSTVETCRAFDPYIVKSLETEIRVATETDLRRINRERMRGNRIQKDIARLRGKALAANAGTLRGSATMAACIDEMAHMIPGESKAAADQVYTALDPSLDQFGLDGLMFCNSSPYSKVGMFYDRYEAALVPFDKTRPIDEVTVVGEEGDLDLTDLNGNPRIFAFQFGSWALFEGYQKKKRFQAVLMASPDWDTDEKDADGDPVWNDRDQVLIRAARAKEAENPESYKVERRGKFAEVTDAYLNPAKVDQMYAGLPTEWLYTNGPNELPKLVLTPFLTNHSPGGPIGRYKFHLDPSSTTAGFGFAIAHTEIIEDWQGREEEHVVFDLIKRWKPQDFPGKTIRWAPIIKELTTLAEIYRPFEITFDQHESRQPIEEIGEILRMKNLSTRVYMQKSTAEFIWKRWEVTKTSIYSGLVHAPNDTEDAKYSALELKFLQQKVTHGKFPKIDRQEVGPVQTKDMADCIAECTNCLIGNQIANRTRERLANSAILGGSPGGYAIGLGSNPAMSGMGPPGISSYYSSKEQKEMTRPSRGVLSRRPGRRGNPARW